MLELKKWLKEHWVESVIFPVLVYAAVTAYKCSYRLDQLNDTPKGVMRMETMLEELKDVPKRIMCVENLMEGLKDTPKRIVQIEYRISLLDANIKALDRSVTGVKKCMISLLMDEEPDRKSIGETLVSDSRVLKGIDNYNRGKYEDAYKAWGHAAKQGSSEATYALGVANVSLRRKLEENGLSDGERKRIQKLLGSFSDFEGEGPSNLLWPDRSR